MKKVYVVVESCVYDNDKLDRPRIWKFENKKEAFDYAHKLCSDWIEECDEDDLREVNELYLTEGKYEYEKRGGFVEFDVQLNGGHVYFDYEGEIDIRVFEI